ncbi:MAG TPA: hypothetical protein VGN05_04580 [Parvibaculum sp.]|jgi:hypothetical protein
MADILAILLTPGAEGEARLRALRLDRHGARLVLLTRPEAAAGLAGLADEVWSEGVAKGPGRFLALVRRISWMSFAEVHDLEASPLTRLMRFCVWPRPKWHLHKHRTGL